MEHVRKEYAKNYYLRKRAGGGGGGVEGVIRQ